MDIQFVFDANPKKKSKAKKGKKVAKKRKRKATKRKTKRKSTKRKTARKKTTKTKRKTSAKKKTTKKRKATRKKTKSRKSAKSKRTTAKRVSIRAKRVKKKRGRGKITKLSITTYKNPSKKKRRKKRKKNPQVHIAKRKVTNLWGTKTKYTQTQKSAAHATKGEIRKYEMEMAKVALKIKYAQQDKKVGVAKTLQKYLSGMRKLFAQAKAGKADADRKFNALARKASVIKVYTRRSNKAGKPYKLPKKKKKARKKKAKKKKTKKQKVSKKTISTWGKRVTKMKKGQKKTYKKGKRRITISVNPKRGTKRKKRSSQTSSEKGAYMKYKKNPTLEGVSGYNAMEMLSLLGGGATYGAVNNWVNRIPGVSAIMAQLQSVFGAFGPGVANSIAPLLVGVGFKYGGQQIPNQQAANALNAWGEGLVAASLTAIGASLGQQLAGGMAGVIYQPEMGAVDYTGAGDPADFGSEGGMAQMGFVPEGLGHHYSEGQLGQDPGMTEYTEDSSDYGTFSPGGLN